jgi:hypothetical protein
MSRARPSSFAGSISLAFGVEDADEVAVGEPAAQRSPPGRFDCDMIVVAPEADLVPGFDAELIAERLGDHDLAFRPDPVSHTSEYNLPSTRTIGSVGASPSEQELEAAHCWEPADRVPGRPAMTEFRRRMRYHHAQWREAHGHPIGSQPIAPKPGGAVRLVGSRVPLDYARDTGANFLTASALDAARARTSIIERHQSFDHQRLWADLLSSEAMSFNLFGDLAADLGLADQAVHTWWPDAPGTVRAVRFAHSPGRLDRAYIGSLVAFDVAFELDLGDGTMGIVCLDTKYHERINRELPKPSRLPRYREVTETSAVFAPSAIEAVNGTDLLVMWLEHLLVLSMLQHPSGRWTWGRYVVVHPAGNSDFAEACSRYRDQLVDHSSLSSMTIEELLDADAFPAPTTSALRDRYLPVNH